MAVSALNDNCKIYDPHYRPDAAALQASSRNRRRYDDFSVSGHLHILKPQSVSLSSSSFQESVQKRSTNAVLYKRSQTLPSECQRPVSDHANLSKHALEKSAGENEAESKSEKVTKA